MNVNRLSTIKLLFRELRYVDKQWQKSQEKQFIVQQLREHKLTQRLLGKAPNELKHLASCYASYLSSTRQLAELQTRYAGAEKSVEESANLVGLSLPNRKN